jgi:hypothetical protein
VSIGLRDHSKGDGNLRSGTGLAALSLEAPNALLSPLRSHLDNLTD